MTQPRRISLTLAFGLGSLAAAGLWLALLAGPAGVGAAGDGWHTAPDAPFLLTRFDAEYSPTTGKVYFLGGRLPDANTDGSVWEFDPLTGVYADTLVDMPVPISNYEIALLYEGDTEVLVVFGGRPQPGGVVNTVQGYRPATNDTVDYSATDPYPLLTAPGGVEVVANIAYVFGGFDAVSTVANTYLFDINAAAGSRFTAGPDLNLSRSYIATAAVDGLIYAVGGDTFDGAALIPQTIVETLDTANPTAWDDAGATDLPVACDENQAFGFDSAAATALAGHIVLAGCGQWPNEIAESMVYDAAADAWSTDFSDLNLARRNHAGAYIPLDVPGAADGLPGVWVWGGRQGSDATLLPTPEFYDVLPPAPAVAVNKTVSSDGSCGDANTLEVLPGSEVTYCYTMSNTGPVSVTVHEVQDDVLGPINGGVFTVTVAPGESLSVTASAILSESVANTVTWTAFDVNQQSAVATATATVTVGTPGLQLTKTVSADGGCGTSSVLEVEAGTEVTYCYTMLNSGDLPLVVHTLEDDVLGSVGPLTQTVAPGLAYSLTLTSVVTQTVTNNATWSAWTAGGLMASGSASATVFVGGAQKIYLPAILYVPAPE
ncbi:MAG: hypothetical protein ACRDHL_03860 [Candidatus Promineifilaceae bacterium]